MGTTVNRLLRYPEGTALANTLHTRIKELAEDVDAQLTVPAIEVIVIGGNSGYVSVSRARRRSGIVTLHVDVARDSASGTGAANSPLLGFALPLGWRPHNTHYFMGMDSATGAGAPAYVNTAGFLQSVFTRPVANGSLLGVITYVCDQ